MVRYYLLVSMLLLGFCSCRPAASDPGTATSKPSANSSSDNAADSPATATSADAAKSKPAPPTATNSGDAPSSADSSLPADIRTLAIRLIEPDPAGGWRISEQSALELEKRGPGTADELWPLLEDKSPEARRGVAFYLLGQFNPNSPEQVDAFLRRLQDDDALVRGIALQAVQQMRQPDLASSQALLVESLDPAREPNPDQRVTVVRVLQRLKAKAGESASSLAKTAESDPDSKVRAAALVALSQVAPAGEVVPVAEKALRDDDAGVRLVAAARLRQLGKQSSPAAEALAGALADDDERVRNAAAEALVRLGAEAVPSLIKQVDAPSTAARQLAIACLSRIGPPTKEALPALEKRLQDEDETVRKLAAVAIGKIKQGQPPATDQK